MYTGGDPGSTPEPAAHSISTFTKSVLLRFLSSNMIKNPPHNLQTLAMVELLELNVFYYLQKSRDDLATQMPRMSETWSHGRPWQK